MSGTPTATILFGLVISAAGVSGPIIGRSNASTQRGSLDWRIEQLAGVRVEDVRNFLALLKKGVAADDRTTVCALATYPLRRFPEDVPNAARCVSEYSTIFDAEVVAAIAKQKFEDLFVSWQGVRIGTGDRTLSVDEKDVWMAGVCRDTACRQYDLRITSVNRPPLFEVAAPGVRVRDVLSGPLAAPGWVTLTARPSDADFACTGHGTLFWSTSLQDGVPHATRIGLREHVDPLPFEVSPDRDRKGNRWVTAVRDGWIIGFDQGEFGGGLWWFNGDGTRSQRVRPGADASASRPVPENVLGLPKVGGEQIVLMGLDHLVTSAGGVFRLERAESGWFLSRLARLDGKPDPWVVDGKQLLFLTVSGLWSVEPRGIVRQLHQTDIGTYSASAIVRARDGAIYVGLRHYVVKLEQYRGQWRETWLTPAACTKVETKGDRCECAG